MSDMTTKFALIPTSWTADRCADVLNAVSSQAIGTPFMFDTPDEALAANIGAGYNKAKAASSYIQISFRVIDNIPVKDHETV